MFFLNTFERPVETPCVGVCDLGADGLCRGCLRSIDEISRWANMSAAEREKVMLEVLPQRQFERNP